MYSTNKFKNINPIEQNYDYEGLTQKGKSPEEMMQFHLSGEADDLSVEIIDRV